MAEGAKNTGRVAENATDVAEESSKIQEILRNKRVSDAYPELDELEKFYDDIYEQQRNICQEYEDYLDELRKLQSEPDIVPEGNADVVEEVAESALEGGTSANPNKIDSLLDGRPELTGSTRDKLLATVQDLELRKIVNELYRHGATVGDGGTAAILVEEFSKGSSTHLLKATERLKQLKKLASSGKLGLNDLDVVEALIDDLESAISLYN